MNEEKQALFEKLGLIYKDTHTSTQLTEQPSARLNLQAFLNGDASCWEQSGDQLTARKKAIVVTSWLLAYPGVDHSNANTYYETLICLIKEGFSLYFPTERGLESVSRSSSPNETQKTSELLALLLQKFTPKNDIDALELAVGANLTRDRMVILSSQRLMTLTQSFYKNKIIYRKDCETIAERSEANHFFVSKDVEVISLNRAMDYIKLEDLEQVQNTDDRYYFSYSLEYPTPEIPDAILNKIDMLSFFATEELLDSEGRNDKAVISQMKAVRTISFSIYSQSENFRQFFAVFPSTRQIKRIKFAYNECISEFQKCHFESLEELSLDSIEISIKELDLLLSCAPNLLHLSLTRWCNIIQTMPETTLTLPPSLQSFRQYNCDDERADNMQLAHFINPSSEIKKLSLILEDSAYDFICQSNLSGLEHLFLKFYTFEYASRSAADFLFRLESAKNLKHLSLDIDTVFDEYEPARPFDLPFTALKSLDLIIKETIYPAELYHLLNAAKSIETLNCKMDKVHSGQQVVPLEGLQQLKKLSLNFSESNQQLMFDILHAAPHINELTIKKLNSDFIYKPEPVKLGQLKSLTLRDTNSNYIHHYLKVLATHAPELETLSIDIIVQAYEKREPEVYCLSALKLLEISGWTLGIRRDSHAFDGEIKTTLRAIALAIALIDIRAPNLESIVFSPNIPLTIVKIIRRWEVRSNIDIVHYPIGEDYVRRSSLQPRLQGNGQLQCENPQVQAPSNLKAAEAISLDGNIADSNAALNAQTIFKAVGALNAPVVDSYHLRLYEWRVSENGSPLQLYRPNEQHLEAVNDCRSLSPQALFSEFEAFNEKSHSQRYYGQYTYKDIEAGRWYQLPALSTEDSLLAMSSLSDHCELKRDQKTGYYFVQFNQSAAAFTLTYIIHSQAQVFSSSVKKDAQLSEPAKLLRALRFKDDGRLDETNDAYQALITYLSQQPAASLLQPLIELCSFNKPFGEQPINEQLPGRLLNALLNQREGACRHRASLFVALASALDLKAMTVVNDVHQFSIYFDRQQAYCVDLGGAPATLEILPMADPVLAQPKPVFDQMNNPFQTWNTRALKAANAKALAEELNGFLAPTRQLVILNSCQDIKGLLEGMLASPDVERCFFSKDLDSLGLEMFCLNDGVSQKIDSPLAKFLKRAQANPHRSYHWYINWSDPEPKHVGYNSVIDDHDRHINDLMIAENVKIVVLCDQVSSARLGEDVYSRMDAVYQAQHIHLKPPKKAMEKQDWNENESGVLLAAHEDWQQLLVQRYRIEGQAYSVEEAALGRAIRSETPLLIYNPPWDDEDFYWFISELQARRGFYFNGRWQTLPRGFELSFAKANLIFPPLPQVSQRGDRVFILNQESFSFFFQHYLIKHNGQLGSSPGFIASAQDSLLDVMVTDNLTGEQWFQLLKAAEKYQVALRISKSHSMELPQGLSAIATEALELPSNVSVILSDDLDFAASQFPEAISVSIDLKSTADGVFFHARRQADGFHGKETDLLLALRAGEDVIIKGHFSRSMQRRVQSLFTSQPALYVNGEWIEVRGRIILITEDSKAFEQVEKAKMNYDVRVALEKLPQAQADFLKTLYQQLKIKPCYSHFLHMPTSADEQHQWFNDLIESLKLSAGIMKEGRQATEAKDVLDYLARHPFVFLCSESGAGKSYFVHHVLKEYAQAQGRRLSIYNGLEKLKDWASQQDSEAVLFIDEANLLAEHFMLFDSFAKGERQLWIEGNRYPLGEQHKLIFAGNPKQYEGRFEADLFKRFPYYLQFHSQGLRNILEPLLFFIEDDFEKQRFLDFIHSYYQKAQEVGLQMTARNAQMICLRYYILKTGNVSQFFKYDILQNYALLSEFEALCMDKKETRAIRQALKEPVNWRVRKSFFYQTLESFRYPSQEPTDNHYIQTPSRLKVKRAIETFLAIRHMKYVNLFQQDTGINGMLFEGEPGLGKSQLCISVLKEQGIDYIYLTPGNHQQARESVLQAFHQGIGVIVDEFNSFADEELWNAVLSGYDLDGQPAQEPGFFVFATQNPVSFHGRKPLSKALMNRMMLFNLNHYSESELVSILELKHKLPSQEARTLTEQYLEARSYASQHRLFPPPNPRAIFSKAQQAAPAPEPEDAENTRPWKRSRQL